jgi:hypothetical protein
VKSTDIYPELRKNLDKYEHWEVAERLIELMSYGEPIQLTHTHQRRQPWVLVPADAYDNLVSVFIAFNHLMETRRQAADPLPSL